MVAAFIAKKGMRAHVVNSSKTLARRDFLLNEKLYESLGIKAGTDAKDLRDKTCKVVYCTGDDVQNNCVESLTAGKASMVDSLRDAVLVVDEVDGLLIDGGSNQTCYFEDRDYSEKVNGWLTQLRNTGQLQGDWDDYKAAMGEMELQNEVEDAWDDANSKEEGRDYTTRGNGIYMLDNKTGKIAEGGWTLWFEILKTMKTTAQWVKYQYPKAILSRLECFMSYTCVFGLTGSLGQKSEKKFMSEHFR